MTTAHVVIHPVDDRAPYALFAMQFEPQANALSARYGAAVYLVGGALFDAEPRDLDVRIVMSPADAERCFGVERAPGEGFKIGEHWCPARWARARDGLKQSRILSARMRRNIDVQFQTEGEATRYAELPRVRIDRAPSDFFSAGIGVP